jgi:vitamin B12 transporter
VVDRLDGFPSGPVSDYTLVNAGLSYSLTDAATAYVRIENLLDEEYQTSAGFGTSDRAFYFGVRATF